MNEILKQAVWWVVQGFAVIPINYHDKRPDARLLPKDASGDAVWEPYKTQLPTMQELQRWFPSVLHNLGLVMGWNNLVVVDFDLWDAYLFWQQLTGIRTYMVKTNRGMHVYFKAQNQPSNSHNEFLDIKANGYVLVPPSIHPSGFEYKLFSNDPIMEINSLEDVLPEELLKPTPPPSHTEFQTQVVQMTDDPWEVAAQGMNVQQGMDLIQSIRQKFTPLDFLPGAEQTSHDGRWWMAPCPFHSDKNPSMWVDAVRGICGCYAGCTEKPLDVVNLYARLHGLTNRDAILIMSHR